MGVRVESARRGTGGEKGGAYGRATVSWEEREGGVGQGERGDCRGRGGDGGDGGESACYTAW